MARFGRPSFLTLVAVLIGLMTTPALAQDTLRGDVVLTNTFESAPDAVPGGTGGVERPAEDVFGLAAGTSRATATVDAGVEFNDFMGLWNIDIDAETVTFTRVASWGESRLDVIASLPGETYDRYYFAFDSPVITSFTTSNQSVLADQGDNGELLVVIEDGYDYGSPGFTVTPMQDLPATGATTIVLVPLALVVVAAGLVLFVLSSTTRRSTG